jgi:hypothetical protein
MFFEPSLGVNFSKYFLEPTVACPADWLVVNLFKYPRPELRAHPSLLTLTNHRIRRLAQFSLAKIPNLCAVHST